MPEGGSSEALTLATCALLALALGPITRWFGHSVQALALMVTGNLAAALYVYHALLLPGTLLHELSHLAMARLLRVPTGRVSLRPRLQRGRMAEFGSVEIESADPVRTSLIGLAPLVVGAAAVWLIARYRLGLWSPNGGLSDLAAAWSRLTVTPDAALWLYLVIAIGNAMVPSPSDRRAWRPMALIMTALVGVLYVAGVLARAPMDALMRGVEMMSFVFAFLLVVDLILGSLCWLLAQGLGRLLGRRLAPS